MKWEKSSKTKNLASSARIARNSARVPAGQFGDDTLGHRADVVDVQLSLGKTRDEALGDRHARQFSNFLLISSANSPQGSEIRHRRGDAGVESSATVGNLRSGVSRSVARRHQPTPECPFRGWLRPLPRYRWHDAARPRRSGSAHDRQREVGALRQAQGA